MRISNRFLAHRLAGAIIVLMASWGTACPQIILPVLPEPWSGQMVTHERVAGQGSPTWAHLGPLDESDVRAMEPGPARLDICGNLHLHARLVSTELLDDKAPWTPGDIVSGEDLSKAISSSRGVKPVVLQVGIEALYKDAHIPDAIFAGPASDPEGLALLKAKARTIARSREAVIYCGCCPWKDCPNIRPAFVALQHMGFKKLKLLNIPTDFKQDWVSKGFPTVKG